MYMFICIFIHTYKHTYIHVCVCVYMCVYVCVGVCGGARGVRAAQHVHRSPVPAPLFSRTGPAGSAM